MKGKNTNLKSIDEIKAKYFVVEVKAEKKEKLPVEMIAGGFESIK